jgi:hypothetical protein
MEKRNTGKYFKYAIGEIVLVVIGILIALQINNWNESRKEKEIEHIYLTNILSDLKDQNASIDIQLESEQEYFEAAGHIIKSYQKNNDLVVDSTFYRFATIITSRKTFVISDPTFTDLISSGNINILKNVENKNRLIKYYQELERIEKIIQNNNSLLVDQNYLSVYNKIGYYFEPDIEGIYSHASKLNEHMIIPRYETELEEISKQLLLIEENKLAFMNAIYLRNIIANGHYRLLKGIQSTTQSLIKEMEKSSSN